MLADNVKQQTFRVASSASKKDVKEEFGKKIKFVLDGGVSEVGLESTIVNLTNKPEILRLGGIEVSRINKVIKTDLSFKNKKKNNSSWLR